MYKSVQYQKVIAAADSETQQQFELVKSLSNNFTEKNLVALDLDRLLVRKLAQADLEETPHSSLLEQKAHSYAKEMIRPYVLRGESYQSIRSGQMIKFNSKYHAQIEKDHILISQVEKQKVSFKFSLKEIFAELAEERFTPKLKLDVKTSPKRRKPAPKPEPKRRKVKAQPKEKELVAKPVERIDDELRFIRRYVLMDGKVKTDQQIRNFIATLQRAIIEKRVRKNSSYASDIVFIQGDLIRVFNRMKNTVKFKVPEDKLDHLSSISGSQKVLLSVKYLKRYIGIQGKNLNKEKVQRLYDLIEKSLTKEQIDNNDPYVSRIKTVQKSLKAFIQSAGKDETLNVHPAVLNGIKTALDGCSCQDDTLGKSAGHYPLAGVADDPTAVVSSVDFDKIQFKTLGFTGKWLELIGDPSPGFTAMVFGRPKLGKSYLCVDFASYLAQNFGPVLYIAREEGLDATLQKKLREKEAIHPNLYISKNIPEDLSNYDFIFLDSVTRLDLAPEDLDELKSRYPEKSFVYVFQTTKAGSFRGTQQFQHDVDIVIEVPEKGKAVQFGRFNQGGGIEIFE